MKTLTYVLGIGVFLVVIVAIYFAKKSSNVDLEIGVRAPARVSAYICAGLAVILLCAATGTSVLAQQADKKAAAEEEAQLDADLDAAAAKAAAEAANKGEDQADETAEETTPSNSNQGQSDKATPSDANLDGALKATGDTVWKQIAGLLPSDAKAEEGTEEDETADETPEEKTPVETDEDGEPAIESLADIFNAQETERMFGKYTDYTFDRGCMPAMAFWKSYMVKLELGERTAFSDAVDTPIYADPERTWFMEKLGFDKTKDFGEPLALSPERAKIMSELRTVAKEWRTDFDNLEIEEEEVFVRAKLYTQWLSDPVAAVPWVQMVAERKIFTANNPEIIEGYNKLKTIPDVEEGLMICLEFDEDGHLRPQEWYFDYITTYIIPIYERAIYIGKRSDTSSRNWYLPAGQEPVHTACVENPKQESRSAYQFIWPSKDGGDYWRFGANRYDSRAEEFAADRTKSVVEPVKTTNKGSSGGGGGNNTTTTTTTTNTPKDGEGAKDKSASSLNKTENDRSAGVNDHQDAGTKENDTTQQNKRTDEGGGSSASVPNQTTSPVTTPAGSTGDNTATPDTSTPIENKGEQQVVVETVTQKPDGSTVTTITQEPANGQANGEVTPP